MKSQRRRQPDKHIRPGCSVKGTCLCSVAGVVTSLSCCGGTVTACVYFRSDWNVGGSCGPKPRAGPCH
jgi:hypothetical protein